MAKKKKNEVIIEKQENVTVSDKPTIVEPSDALKRCKAYRARLVVRKRK